MRQGLDAVNQSQAKASQLTDAFARGTPGVELPQVMLAAAKANVSFRALTRGTQPPRQRVPRHHEHADVI